MHRGAVLAFPGDDGEPLCRFVLERVQWEQEHAGAYLRGEHPRTAGWLLCNPSRASAEVDDPTNKRVVQHSGRNHRPRSLIGNVFPYRTPYPAALWEALERGEITAPMMQANLDALAMIGAQCDLHVVAYGVDVGRRHPALVRASIDAFSLGGRKPLYCFAASDDGHPLHPLARGKHAIRNDAVLRRWEPPH